MSKLTAGFKIAGFGLLLWIVIIVFQVMVSMVTSSYETLDTWWANALTAVVIAGTTWLFSRSLHPRSKKQAIFHGLAWAAALLIISLILVIPNGWTTTFGNWSFYLIFIGATVGPLFGKNIKYLAPKG